MVSYHASKILEIKSEPSIMSISPTTQRVLGLSVAAGYTSLGLFALARPRLVAKTFGLYSLLPSRKDSKHGSKESIEDDAARRAAVGPAATSMLLLAARDLSIAAALWAFDYQGNDRAFGTLIVSGMPLYVIDVYYIWQLRGAKIGGLFAAGAAIWVAIGALYLA